MERQALKIIVLLLSFFLFTEGCRSVKKVSSLEEKVPSVTAKAEEETKAKDKSVQRVGKIETLEPEFAEEAGRVNPFVPITAGYESAGAAGAADVAPSPASPRQVPTPLPYQLPPLPEQEVPERPKLEIPKWPSESPVISAGPSKMLSAMLKLRLTGIMYGSQGKAAIVEEIIYDEMTKKNVIRSYVVREGKTFGEYRLQAKKITKNKVVLTKGNQRIELGLVETPVTSPVPSSQLQFISRPSQSASPVRYQGGALEEGGEGGGD